MYTFSLHDALPIYLFKACYIITITYITNGGWINVQIKLDFESDEPIYTQLTQQIITSIAKKELLPGERLPSVRALAADIGINLHTVIKPYKQLNQGGFI